MKNIINMGKSFERGSEWRKWDLHVHTPESGLSNQFKKDWDAYVKALFESAIDKDIAVIGITDYFTIDGYKKLKNDYLDKDEKLYTLFSEEQISKIKKITILPNIEFRLHDVVKTNRINYHVIFSDEVSIEDIEENFLHDIDFVYEELPFESANTRKLKKKNLEEFGAKIKKEQSSFEGSDFSVGCAVATIQEKDIRNLLVKQKDKFAGKYLIVVPVDEDLSEVSWNGQDHQVRKGFYQHANMFFATNLNTIEFALGKKHRTKEDYLTEFKSFKPCVCGSDAHKITDLFKCYGNKFCWIKADPTFEGLKQLLYEPEERVKIQETSPALGFEKSPFTEIVFEEDVKLFDKDDEENAVSDEDNISFATSSLKLNEGLVSIIGGRGTGKSKLIDYISNGLGVESKIKYKYTRSNKVIVKRKTSLLEPEKEFNLSDDNNIPFMYISQSEIKDIVENSQEFSKKIRSLIGINSDYSVSSMLGVECKDLLYKYDSLIRELNKDETTSFQKKESLEKRIKQNEDFINNVTSEENKSKLESYKNSIKEVEEIKGLINEITIIRNKVESFQDEINGIIQNTNLKLNKLIACDIPFVNFDSTKDIIRDRILKLLEEKLREKNDDIDKTRLQFSDYKGELTTLLDNVQKYQTQVDALRSQKTKIEESERNLQQIVNNQVKELGAKIEKELTDYSKEITQKWDAFISGKDTYNEKQKNLLKLILGGEKENIELKVNLILDVHKLYNMILESLDKRTWKRDTLFNVFQIKDFQSYVDFLKNNFRENILGESFVLNTIDVLDVLCVRFKEYISHEIVISSNGKPLKNLSVV